MVITSKLRRHKVMERAMRALMGNNLPPRFKFKDTYDSIEVPTTHQQHLPSQATLEAKFDELIAEEDVVAPTTQIKADMVVSSNLEVGTSNLFVDTETGNVGIGTTSPGEALHIYRNDANPTYMHIVSDTSNRAGIALSEDKTNKNVIIEYDGTGSGVGNYLAFYSGISSWVGKGAGLNYVPANGHVGIGTASPATKLHVEHYGSAIGDFEGIRIANHATNLHATSRPAYEFVVSDINSGTGIGHGKFAIGYRGTTSASRTDRLVIDNSGNVGIGTTSPGIVLDVGSSLSNPQIGRNYATGSVHDADKRDAIYFGRWDGTGRDFLGIKCRVDTHTALGYGDYSNQTKLEFYTWGNNYASSREVMCIRGDGNVGIGTNAPQAALHVAGDSGPSNTSKVLGVHMGVYSSIYPHIEIVASGSNTGWIDFKNANTGGNGDHSERIRGGSGHLEFITNMSERMRIDSSGNVGIGTTSPDTDLHIYGSTSQTNIFLGETGTPDKAGIIKYYQGDNSSNPGRLAFGSWGDNFSTGASTMCIKKGGFVGIGTTNPTHQLHIGPKDNDHIYLASSNNSYGWTIDTDDQGSGTVPFRIIKRTGGVDSTVLTIKNQDGKIGIGTSNSPTELLHVCARSSSESAFIRIQSGSGGTNPATESGIKLTESGQYGFQFVHSAVTDLLKVKHQDSNGSVDKDDIMVWHPNGAVQWGVTSRYNFHYNPNTWSYATNLYNTTTNFWSVNYYFDHEGYVFVTSYGHWARKDANNSSHAGGNQAFYGWISVDNKEVADSSLYDNFSGSTSSYNKFHEYQSPDTNGAGSWRDFSHTALYKVSAGWHSFSLRVTVFFGSSHYLNINGSGLIGFYIPKHYL